MSQFYDQASLVMIPSGYKNGKVYSQKPLSTDGELTFSRASNATRVNSSGLVEKVRENVALYSQEFNNANWSTTNVTVTANTTAAPDGTTTADSLAFTASSSARTEGLTAASSPAGEITLSIYAKVSSGTGTFRLRGDWSGGSSTSSDFTATTSWQRFSHTFTAASALQIMSIYNGTSATAQTIIFWAAQAESGVMTDYIATTSAAVSVGPVSGLPRLDYLNSTCPRLLLEPQRTNSQINSENFAALAYENGTITSNNTTSPDGYVNADLYTEDTTNSYHRINVGAQTYTNGSSYTFSVFAKANGTGRYLCVNAQSAFLARTFFDLNTGVIALTELGSATITNYGNGWYRCTVTGTRTSSTSSDSMYFGLTTGLVDINYTGNGTTGFWGWGVQIENSASYATSYIPTLGTSVTRVADAASKTSASALIGQTEGTLFVEEYYDATAINAGGLDDTLLSTSDGTSSNLISIFHYGNGGLPAARKAIFFIRLSGATQAVITSDALPTGTYKMALAYKNNDVVAYINGVQIGTDTSATIPATSVVTLVDPITTNAATKTVNIKQALVFKTRLSNSDLATLTTL